MWGTHAMSWWKSERSFCVACRYSTVLAWLLSSPSQEVLPACQEGKGGNVSWSKTGRARRGTGTMGRSVFAGVGAPGGCQASS